MARRLFSRTSISISYSSGRLAARALFASVGHNKPCPKLWQIPVPPESKAFFPTAQALPSERGDARRIRRCPTCRGVAKRRRSLRFRPHTFPSCPRGEDCRATFQKARARAAREFLQSGAAESGGTDDLRRTALRFRCLQEPVSPPYCHRAF